MIGFYVGLFVNLVRICSFFIISLVAVEFHVRSCVLVILGTSFLYYLRQHNECLVTY